MSKNKQSLNTNDEKRIAVTITHLKMERGQNNFPLRAFPTKNADLQKIDKPHTEQFKFFYKNVGRDFLWWERLLWSDDDWNNHAKNSKIKLYILYDDDRPAGFFELNFSSLPTCADLAFFGLMPHAIGRGFGRALLQRAVQELFLENPDYITVNTCTLDHKAALPLYKTVGFSEYNKENITIIDPRSNGLIC
jgi:GNAT superfamily N-acetyltransferase